MGGRVAKSVRGRLSDRSFFLEKNRQLAPTTRAICGPMHQLVSPEGVLHLLPDDKRAKRMFCKAHQGKLRVAYLNNHLAGDEKYKKSHAGWQLLHMVKWLRNESSGAQVMVIGCGQSFFKAPARAAACERAGLCSSAMSFDEKEVRTFNRLLLGEVAAR